MVSVWGMKFISGAATRELVVVFELYMVCISYSVEVNVVCAVMV